MNPVVLTIINPRKKYWPSRGSDLCPPVLKFTMLPSYGAWYHVQKTKVQLKPEIRFSVLTKQADYHMSM